jgi:dynein heavy chain
MRSSPYAKPLVASLKAWEDFLRFTSALLEEWLKMQSSWLYLEPIFSSEGMSFFVVDKSFLVLFPLRVLIH